MEQGLVQPVDGSHPGCGALEAAAVRLAVLELLAEIAAASQAGRVVAVRNDVTALVAAPSFLGALAPELLLVLVVLGDGGGTVLAANVGDAEDGLPALGGEGIAARGGEAEAGRGEGALGPAVVDAGDVPVHGVGRGVAVELVADVDEMLD